MVNTAMSMRRTGGANIILIALLLLLGLLAIAAVESTVTSRSHAMSKHGAAVTTHARMCNQQNNVNQIWYSHSRGTKIELCEMNLEDWADPDKTWTLRVIDAKTKEEITVFGHTGDYFSVEDYLVRQLYIFLE